MITKQDIEQTFQTFEHLKEVIDSRFFKWREVTNNKLDEDDWYINSFNGEEIEIHFIEPDYDYHRIVRKHVPLTILTCSDDEFQQMINDIISECNKQAVAKKEKSDRRIKNEQLVAYRESKKQFESEYAEEQLKYCNILHRYYEATQDTTIFMQEDDKVFKKLDNNRKVLDLSKIYFIKRKEDYLIYECIVRDQTIDIHLNIDSLLNEGIN